MSERNGALVLKALLTLLPWIVRSCRSRAEEAKRCALESFFLAENIPIWAFREGVCFLPWLIEHLAKQARMGNGCGAALVGCYCCFL